MKIKKKKLLRVGIKPATIDVEVRDINHYANIHTYDWSGNKQIIYDE